MLFSWQEMAVITGGAWDRVPAGDCTGISTNSREVGPGELFLALSGDRFDGHNFVASAFATGAAAACVSRDVGPGPKLLVTDTLRAYQDLGRARHRKFPQLLRVGLTGSSGKTSTKEMIASIFAAAYPDRVLATRGNTNNLVGVPQNLLRLRPEDAVAVIEMGTNQPGEIATLAAIAEPDIAVLTNVGAAHVEGLSLPGDQGLEGVAREKSCIFNRLAERGGTAVLPFALRENPFVVATLGAAKCLSFGQDPQADVFVRYQATASGADLTFLRPKREPLFLSWGIPGRHQALNAAAAVAAASIAGLSDATIVAGLQGLQLPGMRMKVEERDGVQWINDAYNANPDSVRALVDWLAEMPAPAGRLYVLLGDMLELGSNEAQYHRETLDYARRQLPQAELLAVGSRMVKAVGACGLPAVPSVAAAREQLLKALRAGDRVAFKGSRGMAMEGLLP